MCMDLSTALTGRPHPCRVQSSYLALSPRLVNALSSSRFGQDHLTLALCSTHVFFDQCKAWISSQGDKYMMRKKDAGNSHLHEQGSQTGKVEK